MTDQRSLQKAEAAISLNCNRIELASFPQNTCQQSVGRSKRRHQGHMSFCPSTTLTTRTITKDLTLISSLNTAASYSRAADVARFAKPLVLTRRAASLLLGRSTATVQPWSSNTLSTVCRAHRTAPTRLIHPVRKQFLASRFLVCGRPFSTSSRSYSGEEPGQDGYWAQSPALTCARLADPARREGTAVAAVSRPYVYIDPPYLRYTNSSLSSQHERTVHSQKERRARPPSLLPGCVH